MKLTRLLPFALVLVANAMPSLADVPVNISAPREAKVGETVVIDVTSVPKAKAKIEAQDTGLTQAYKLMDKKTDGNGKVSWKFDIPQDYKANEMPIIVTIIHDGAESKSSKAIKVVK